MALDFSKYFDRYEELVAEVDNLFVRFEKDFPDQVKCEKGCCDCCYALFDLSLVEALYINHHFREQFSGRDKNAVMEAADQADRQIFKLKRKLFKASKEGKGAHEIMSEVARARVRCPMLGEGDLCRMYDRRPLTCRLYGVPTAIAGKGHTCAKSGFVAGEKYPTVSMDALHDRLLAISQELADDIQSRYKQLGDVLMPLSTAVLNIFNDEYLGIRDAEPKEQAAKPAAPKPVEPKAPEAAPVSEACASCTEDKSKCQTCAEKSFSIVLGGPDKDGE
ncbi:YkgJ family cysteine cluster protein [Salidesulfovibrio onnuriiensis]|uniref:YkgJ family cysteine cluster protein n=1 Tax=Salidesulfovibrio onnuriiensis TaxID=2583823 RepID=UPI0011C74F70|nr:YkgJ family cysteine cluster protein [Salidesulfovibrio onnuriiensis]